MIIGPRRTGRTTAGLLSAVALAGKETPVNFVVWAAVEETHVINLLNEHFPQDKGRLFVRIVPWQKLKTNSDGLVCVFDHRVTEQLAMRNPNDRHT